MINNNRCTSSTLDVLVTYNKGLVPSVSMMGRYLFAYNVYDGIFYMKVVQDGSVRVISTNTANYPESIRSIIDISEQPSTTGYLKKTAKNTWTLVGGIETSESDPIFSSWVSTTFTSIEGTLIKGSLTDNKIPVAIPFPSAGTETRYISDSIITQHNSKIGIGKSTPEEVLDVVGSIRQSGITSTMVKVDSDGKFVAASVGTDYGAPLGFTPEDVSNKKKSLTENSDTYYPTQKAVKTAVDGKSDVGHTHSYLTDIVNDTTPQLGGDLDKNGNEILNSWSGIQTATSSPTIDFQYDKYEVEVDLSVVAGVLLDSFSNIPVITANKTVYRTTVIWNKSGANVEFTHRTTDLTQGGVTYTFIFLTEFSYTVGDNFMIETSYCFDMVDSTHCRVTISARPQE